MVAMTRSVTFHLTPAAVWAVQSSQATYVPEGFADEGFVHFTNGEAALLETANRYYQGDLRPYVVLAVDLARVAAPVTYDDPERRFPHVHGPIDRVAVISVREIERGEQGTFHTIGKHLE